MALLSDAEAMGSRIEVKPLQSVAVGPYKTQLRFFSEVDAKNALALMISLGSLLGDIEIVDFSEQYRDVSWLRPGHFELWIGTASVNDVD